MYSSVKVCAKEELVPIEITSTDKPKVSESAADKWQRTIDLIALEVNIPAALIMQLEKDCINVFCCSNTDNNPYKKGSKAKLHSGLYCETVVGNQTYLLVPNAVCDIHWRENPDIELDMISYLGFPIRWPDGELFGTLCVLDRKENHYNAQFIKLIELFRDSIEKDLDFLMREDRLSQSEKKYRELFDHMRSAVAIYKVKDGGETFVLEECNKALELIEKIDQNRIVGRDVKELFPSLSRNDILNAMKTVWEDGAPRNVTPFFYEDQRIKGWRDNYYIYKLSPEQIVVVYDDISEKMEQQRIIRENERALRETLQLEQLRMEFFANISHELRTPLNMILSALQINEILLQSEGRENNINKIIGNMSIERQNCLRLLRLINNLIDSTALDSKILALNMTNCDIVSLMKEITQSVSSYIANHNLNLTISTDVDKKVIACDLDKIERIVLNLLSNSVKFTPPGGSIFVNIMDGQEYITITVEDTGIGIPEDKTDIIFDRFRKIDTSFTRSYEGSGIGLSLVKSLIEMHEGSISVESKLGEGTVFIMKFPVRSLNYQKDHRMENRKQNSLVEKIKVEFSDIYKLNRN